MISGRTDESFVIKLITYANEIYLCKTFYVKDLRVVRLKHEEDT